MLPVVGGIVWGGLTLGWWGWTRVRGCPASMAELILPGRYRGCNVSTPTVDPDSALKPAPAADRAVGGRYQQPNGQVTTSPPSSEGAMSRVRKP